MTRPYARISDEVRRAIVEKFEKDEDYVALAAELGIKRTTAMSIAKKGAYSMLPIRPN